MRVSGVSIPKQKRVVISLTYIFGVGLVSSQKILKKANIDEDVRVKDLTRDQEDAIRAIVEKEFKTSSTCSLKNGLLYLSGFFRSLFI